MYLSLLSFSLLLTFPLCNPSVGIVFTNTSERMGICQGCLEKRCDSVELWDCYMSAEFPAYERSSLPCSLSKQTPKKTKRTHLHLCVTPELPSCQTAHEPSASEDTKGVLQSSCQMQSHLMQITAPRSHTHRHTPGPPHICYAQWGLATNTPWRFLKHTYERVNFQSIASY